MHLQEFAENSTDFAHFGPLHGVMGFPFTGIDMPMKMVTINHIPDWKEGTGEEAHMAWFLNKADLNIFGKHSPDTGAMAVISFVGPGGLVFFSFDTPLGSLVLIQTNTPIEAMRMEVAFRSVSLCLSVSLCRSLPLSLTLSVCVSLPLSLFFFLSTSLLTCLSIVCSLIFMQVVC
jgi:hypothetical protein